MRPTTAVLLFLGFALPVTTLTAQAPRLEESVEVRLIEIDVVVTDRAGNPVEGLAADDFELLENGKRQKITHLAEHREADPAAAPSSPVADVSRTYEPPRKRSIVVLFDAVSLFGAPRRKLFDDLRGLLRRVVRDGDRVQFLVWNDQRGVRTVSPATSDENIIELVISTLEGTRNAETGNEAVAIAEDDEWARELEAHPLESGVDAEQEDRLRARLGAEAALAVMRRKTGAIQRIISSLGGSDSRGVLLYVSSSFGRIAGGRMVGANGRIIDPLSELQYDSGSMLDAVARTAKAEGVVFYAFRPYAVQAQGGIGTLAQDAARFGAPVLDSEITKLANNLQALEHLAEETGGIVGLGPEGISRAVEQMVTGLSSYYTLAYSSPTDGHDDERRLTVRTKDPDHVVRSQASVVHRSDRTRARDALMASLFEERSGGDIEFGLEVGRGRPARRGQAIIPVTLTIPVEQLRFEDNGKDLVATFSVLVAGGQNVAQTTDVVEDTKQVTAPRGTKPTGHVTYKLTLMADRNPTTVSIAVFDDNSGMTGVRTIETKGISATVR